MKSSSRTALAAAALILLGAVDLKPMARRDMRPNGEAGPVVVREATKFPELEITRDGGTALVGKILRIEDDTDIVCLPAPYWGVETVSFPIDKISSIKNHDVWKERPLIFALAFGGSMGLGYGAAVLSSGYRWREDYKKGFMGSLGAVAGGGLFGLLVGSGSWEWDLAGTSAARKLRIIERLMGI